MSKRSARLLVHLYYTGLSKIKPLLDELFVAGAVSADNVVDVGIAVGNKCIQISGYKTAANKTNQKGLVNVFERFHLCEKSKSNLQQDQFNHRWSST